MADPINTPGTTANPNANTTTTAGTTTGTTGTRAGYDAETVRVEPAGTATTHTHDDKSSTKGLIVGVLTFLALSLWEWFSGPADAETNAGAALDSITFPEIASYAVVGIIVGVIVKAIDKSRQKKHHA